MTKLSINIRNDEEYRRLKGLIGDNLVKGPRAFRAGEIEMLLRIRDQRLYLGEYASFEEFCRRTCKITKSHANNLIRAYQMREDLKAQGVTVLPSSERVARELTRYPKADRKRIWLRAQKIAGSSPTYKTVQQAAAASEIGGA
jgi:hypothetical protein